jgi:hypothetical protein
MEISNSVEKFVDHIAIYGVRCAIIGGMAQYLWLEHALGGYLRN